MKNYSPFGTGSMCRTIVRWVGVCLAAGWAPIAVRAQTVPTTGLVGYWAGNGNTNDSSASGNNGTFSGSYAAGISGMAFQISSGTYVTIPDIPAYTFSDFSVDFWFEGAVGSGVFVGQDDGGGTTTKWFVDYGYGNAGKFEIHLNGVATAGFYPSNAVTLDSAWHNLAVVKSGSTYTFYYDGALIGSASASGSTFPDPAAPLIFGYAEPNVPNYTGLLEDVALYNVALTSGEVLQLATIPEPAASPAVAAMAALGITLLKIRKRRVETTAVAP